MVFVNYPVGDFLIRIKNTVLASNREFDVASTKFIKQVAKVLEKARYLEKVEEKDGRLTIRLAYHKKEPVLMDIKLVSKPGLRVYMAADELEKKKGPSVYILSTSKGVMTSREAIKHRLGGEVIAEVW